ncbi:iron complex transport system ATP-binding protein [Metabacillus crassostreae]|uniref:adenosylcobinamide amidohydrolase n=1 Tax=Metabacillus crassostreae TaxID=929098 RepID=UPI00195BAD28|nr:adenosylcobinamide amidohydrolase [Metabacillus crassostreae]MBM7602984.1 iron complex transport system ATP-binding protein [Metabacillus crassostreae]
MITLQNVSGGYLNKSIVKNISFTIEKGHFYALIGPNGSGKTTLSKLITGVLPLQSGSILILDKSLKQYSSIQRAEMMAVLSQEASVEFDFSVEEIVMLGRYPHQKGFFKTISNQDKQIVKDVMEKTYVYQYRKKLFKQLSGGEKQRVLLAKALAQEPKILILDEPTNHLDMRHTLEMLQHLKDYQKQHDLTILAILHDLNIASLFSDKIGLLHHGHLVETGDLSLLQKEEKLQEVYEVAIKTSFHPVIAKPQISLIPKKQKPLHTSLDHTMNTTKNYIHIYFPKPLRTISNAVLGEGLYWSRNFCNFHVPYNYNCSNPKQDIQNWLQQANISSYDTVGMMTAVILKDKSVIRENIEGVEILSIITAGVGNAVDITHDHRDSSNKIGTVNIMVFLDAHLTDGALVNSIQSVTEAKTKAFYDLNIKDHNTQTIATGTSTDSTLIASTQHGELTPYAGSGTSLGKAIGKVVYNGLIEAIKNYEKRKKI